MLIWVGACMGMLHGLFNHRLLFAARTLTEAPASFSGLAHTSVTTSLWIVSDGDDDEVFMEHCYVAWCQCRPARHPLQIGPRNYLPAQAELSSDSVSFFLSMHRLGWARCWVNVDIASSYLSTLHLHTDMIILRKCFFESGS